MANTTRWKDETDRDFNQVINLLCRDIEDDPEDRPNRSINWRHSKLDNNLTINLNGRDVEFNLIEYKYERIKKDDPTEDSVQRNFFIIPYYNQTSINYIISCNSGALFMLRKILCCKHKNEIVINSDEFSEDFFIWLIYKVFKQENEIETCSQELSNIFIDSIKAFKASTNDTLTSVSAKGESVMNLISTLSFLLESNNFRYIKLVLENDEHKNIELSFTNGGGNPVSIELDQYIGIFNEDNDEVKKAKLYLLAYIEILPVLFQAYEDDRQNGLWSKTKYEEFLKDVAGEVTDKISSKVTNLGN